jgi:HSP20 family protein
LTTLQDEILDTFDRFFGQPLAEGTWAPPLDISETDDAIHVRAELPGIEAKDVHLEVHGDVLQISGEKKRESSDEGDNYYRTERYWGGFQRAVTLPSSVDVDKVEATCRKGVLSVKLPKAESAKTKRIEVKG